MALLAKSQDDTGVLNALIASQNDAFRKDAPEGGTGVWVRTDQVDDRGDAFYEACVEAVKAYDGFTKKNDPDGTHDMGFMEIDGEPVWWKIDLYNEELNGASPNPTDIAVTRRVLTIFFPSEH